jgi:cation transport regulator ChaC
MSGNNAAPETAEPESAIRLLPGQTALVGYGSLLSRPSLEQTLGRTYTGPFLQCSVRGWRRTWDAAMPNRKFYVEGPAGRMTPEAILYLNVRRDPSTSISGVVFVVDQDELEAYDRRESIYDRVDVTAEMDVKIDGGPAYMYVCRPEYCLSDVKSPERAAVRATYLRLVENGLSHLDEDFRRRYADSTDTAPAHLVIEDRVG